MEADRAAVEARLDAISQTEPGQIFTMHGTTMIFWYAALRFARAGVVGALAPVRRGIDASERQR
jgi:heme/copper-type cytochrome/quinol oxidase subunit 1